MDKIAFPVRILRRFVEALSSDIGQETFSAVLSKAGLPEEWASFSNFSKLDDVQTAQAYSRLQFALRTYYGRGARGILMRIGSKLWRDLLDDSAIGFKAQAAIIRGLPKPSRRNLLWNYLCASWVQRWEILRSTP